MTGATSGIGNALTLLLAKKGFRLILSGRNKEQLQELKEKLPTAVIDLFYADLSTKEGQQRVVQALWDFTPDIIVNNAGFGLYGEAIESSTEEQLAMLEVNGAAPLRVTLEAAKALSAKKKKGVIVNLSSVAAFQVLPGMAVYAASKAFLSHFSQALDFEMKGKGIRILTSCPGVVATHFQRRAGSDLASREFVMSAPFVAEQIWKQIKKEQPLMIIDWKYRVATFFSFFIPKCLIAALVARQMKKRANNGPH